MCTAHLRADFLVESTLHRFCQKCNKPEPVSAFTGTKRSCALKLEQHNSVRRDRYRTSARRSGGKARATASPSRASPVRSGPASPASGSADTLPMDLGELMSLWMEKGDPGESLSLVGEPTTMNGFSLDQLMLRASAPQPFMGETEFAGLWLKLPETTPDQVPWTGARTALSSALACGLDAPPDYLNLSGHIRPGCVLLSMDVLLLPSLSAAAGRAGAGAAQPPSLSASAALRALLSGDGELAAFLRAQPKLTLGLERSGPAGASRRVAVSLNGEVQESESEAVPEAQMEELWVSPSAVHPEAREALYRLVPSSATAMHEDARAEELGEPKPEARLHGQSVPLEQCEQGLRLPLLPTSACGALLLHFAQPPSEAGAPSFATAPLLLCSSHEVVAEVNASASALLRANPPASAAERGRLRTALVTVGHALRLDSNASEAERELAAVAAVAAMRLGWSATARLVLSSIAASAPQPLAQQLRLPSSGGASLAHAAVAVCQDWALEAVLAAGGSGAGLGGAGTPAGLSRTTPLHLAISSCPSASLASLVRTLTRSPEGVAAWFVARNVDGYTPRALLESRAASGDAPAVLLLKEMDSGPVGVAGREANALFRTTLEVLRSGLGIFNLDEALALGPELLLSSPELAKLRTLASERAMPLALAFFRQHAVERAATASARYAAGEEEEEAGSAKALKAAAQAAEDAAAAEAATQTALRSAYETERAAANIPSALMFMLLLFAYEQQSNAARRRWNLTAYPADEKAALLASGAWLDRETMLRIIFPDSNWSTLWVTLSLFALLLCAAVFPAARSFYARNCSTFLLPHLTLLYIVNPIRAAVWAAPGGLLLLDFWTAKVMYTYTFVVAMSPLNARQLCAFLLVRLAVMLALVPQGLFIAGGHSWRGAPGKYPFSHYLLGQTVVTCGLVARLYLLDKQNFATWRARRVSAKTKMA